MRGGDPDPPPRKRGGGGALLAPSSQCVDGLLNPHPSAGGRAIWALEKRHTKKAHINDMQRKRNTNLIPGLGEQNVKNKPIFFVNLEHPGSENMQFSPKKACAKLQKSSKSKLFHLKIRNHQGKPHTQKQKIRKPTNFTKSKGKKKHKRSVLAVTPHQSLGRAHLLFCQTNRAPFPR